MHQLLTTGEVAALVGLEERRVRKDVEHGFFGAASPPRFAFAAVVYFRAIALLGLQLGTEDRRRLYEIIKRALAASRAPARVDLGPVTELKLGDIVAELTARLKRFGEWKQRIVTDESILGGEPVFPRSRLSVRHVGTMLLRGAAPKDVREDYPYLTNEDLEFAKLFAEAYPRVGRPREAAAR